MSAHPQRRALTSLLVVLALVVAAVGALALRTRPGAPRNDEAESRGGSHAMTEALEKHPGLAEHRLPLAFVAEKLEQQGGEATGEIVNGPSQEAYDQRAYPRTTVAVAQQKGAKAAATRARIRARTAAGARELARAQGTASPGTWTALGPNGGFQVPESTYTHSPTYVSGRVTAMETGTTCTTSSCTLYVGTAGGGLWKTTNALAAAPTWRAIGTGLPSTAIGTVYRAPRGGLFVGTGEPNGSSDSEAGLGLFKSTDGGLHFTKVRTAIGTVDFTLNRGVGAVAVDPRNASHLLVGTTVARHGSSAVNGGRFTPPGTVKVGLYESRDGGGSWSLALSKDSDTVDPQSPNGADFFRGGITKITFDPSTAGTAYASMSDYGLFRATTAGGPWKQIYTIKTPGDPVTGLASRIEFALARLPRGRTRIYLGDSTYFDNATAALLRSDAGKVANPKFRLLSDPTPGTPGFGSYNFCQTQCSYDMIVTSPRGKPGEVFLAGAMNYDELQVFGGAGSSNGRAIMRSTDAGVHVTDMTNDAQAQANGLHPDQHALVFAPAPTGVGTFFSGSDGGVWRHSGPYVNKSADCVARQLSGTDLVDCQQYLSAVPTLNQTLNRGLQTLQFQSVSVTPDGVVQGGTQDNGTWESDQSGFATTVGGDGGQSDFNVTDARIRYHSYFGPQHDVSFDGGSPQGWNWIGDPLVASGEAASFYVPLTADPKVAGTVFDGLQHVWRTTDDGGGRAFLERYCNELTGDYPNRPKPCGDWEPLGGAAGDLSGGDPANYVVALERAPSDTGTLWAATRLGNLYVSENADANKAGSVTYQQYDVVLGLPKRFPSGIAVDPKNPNHAFVSYSGYSAYSPGGHVFDVTVDPSTGQGSAQDLSANLGDQPVTDIVYVASTNALFAGTDFGVMTRLNGPGGSWVATPGLPPVAVYGLTLDSAHDKLYAATHGRSAWWLQAG